LLGVQQLCLLSPFGELPVAIDAKAVPLLLLSRGPDDANAVDAADFSQAEQVPADG
jgi:hypothetical protein